MRTEPVAVTVVTDAGLLPRSTSAGVPNSAEMVPASLPYAILTLAALPLGVARSVVDTLVL
ncbi:MAG: hypothetical protein MK538_09065 [Planctomycetes bacterium]|nr:hypothetical protein [Planctomycetota bacterium]